MDNIGERTCEMLVTRDQGSLSWSWKVKGSLRKKEKEVRQSLVGCFDQHHRYMLDLLWKQYQFLSRQPEQVEAKIRREMEPHCEFIELLDGVPGMDEMVAWTLIAEMGTDMDVFPTAGHVASWAGMCPGTNESAGRQMDTRRRARRIATCERFSIG
jgi:transposase